MKFKHVLAYICCRECLSIAALLGVRVWRRRVLLVYLLVIKWLILLTLVLLLLLVVFFTAYVLVRFVLQSVS